MNVLEDEWYAVRHSGEIPEVALYSALFYLSHDNSGPGLSLTSEQNRMLVEAAEIRYREIVLRDLQQANRNTTDYRGIKRSIINWQRFKTFCSRQQLDSDGFRREVAELFLLFVKEEEVEVKEGLRDSSINCTFEELCGFASQLGLSLSALPESINELCS